VVDVIKLKATLVIYASSQVIQKSSDWFPGSYLHHTDCGKMRVRWLPHSIRICWRWFFERCRLFCILHRCNRPAHWNPVRRQNPNLGKGSFLQSNYLLVMNRYWDRERGKQRDKETERQTLILEKGFSTIKLLVMNHCIFISLIMKIMH